MRSSQRAVDLIVEFETGGKAGYYDPHPCWPGGASGVTIGIGCDLGYHTPEDIVETWGPLLPHPWGARLSGAAGITSDVAQSYALILSDITVPWDIALRVFEDETLPKAEAQVLATFENSEELPPDCFGALVSLVYNRGTSLEGPRRVEMANIASWAWAHQWDKVPDEIRAMKRLWPDVHGLQRRRDAEADLFQAGLSSTTEEGNSP